MTFNKSLWARGSEIHPTPKPMFDELDKVYHFDLDAASSPDNPMGTPKFYTELDDGLVKSWEPTTWLNPPFFRIEKRHGVDVKSPMMMKWATKAHSEALKGNVVVMLVGSRMGTRWTQNVCLRYAKMLCFVKGRLKFGTAKHGAPFDSVLYHFSLRKPTSEEFEVFSKFGLTYYINNPKHELLHKKGITKLVNEPPLVKTAK